MCAFSAICNIVAVCYCVSFVACEHLKHLRRYHVIQWRFYCFFGHCEIQFEIRCDLLNLNFGCSFAILKPCHSKNWCALSVSRNAIKSNNAFAFLTWDLVYNFKSHRTFRLTTLLSVSHFMTLKVGCSADKIYATRMFLSQCLLQAFRQRFIYIRSI